MASGRTHLPCHMSPAMDPCSSSQAARLPSPTPGQCWRGPALRLPIGCSLCLNGFSRQGWLLSQLCSSVLKLCSDTIRLDLVLKEQPVSQRVLLSSRSCYGPMPLALNSLAISLLRPKAASPKLLFRAGLLVSSPSWLTLGVGMPAGDMVHAMVR